MFDCIMEIIKFLVTFILPIACFLLLSIRPLTNFLIHKLYKSKRKKDGASNLVSYEFNTEHNFDKLLEYRGTNKLNKKQLCILKIILFLKIFAK